MLRRYLDVLALNTAGVANDKLLYDSAGIARQTAHHYEQLLVNLRVVEKVPTWTSTPIAPAAKHLAWFRDQIGDQFVVGVVFHTGSRVYSLGERIVAAPIATIWS